MARRTYRAGKIQISFDGDICIHTAWPAGRLRRIQLLQIADDHDDTAVTACELRIFPAPQ
jgi:hypothetical protein